MPGFDTDAPQRVGVPDEGIGSPFSHAEKIRDPPGATSCVECCSARFGTAWRGPDHVKAAATGRRHGTCRGLLPVPVSDDRGECGVTLRFEAGFGV